jgi:hypothetical protein
MAVPRGSGLTILRFLDGLVGEGFWEGLESGCM